MNTRDNVGTVRVLVTLVNSKVGGNAAIKGNIIRAFTFHLTTVSKVADRVKRLKSLIVPK